MAQYFKIKNIKTKNGFLKNVHKDMHGKRCYILSCTVGSCALIRVENDPWDYHTVMTTKVQQITSHEDGSFTIETKNTYYTLEEYCDEENTESPV